MQKLTISSNNINPFIDHPNLADYIWGVAVGKPWLPTLSNDTFSQSKILMYPNPVKNVLQVSGLASDSTINLYSLLGITFYNKTTATSSLAIDVVIFSAGVYILQIETQGKVLTK